MTATGFAVLAQTGELRRMIERVEKAALELEQAVQDLNRAKVGIEVKPPESDK